MVRQNGLETEIMNYYIKMGFLKVLYLFKKEEGNVGDTDSC